MCYYGACSDNSVLPQNNTGQDHRIHPYPTIFTYPNVFGRQVLVQIFRVVVFCYQSDILSYICAFAYIYMTSPALVIATRFPKVIHIIYIKMKIFYVSYRSCRIYREGAMSVITFYFLIKPKFMTSLDSFRTLKLLTFNIFFFV